jgi:acetolactate synthase I/II/III large subunit
MRVRVADYIARHLDGIGVRAAFMVSGGMMMHLMDAVSRYPRIRYFCNHHEQASAMAADAYARKTGGIGFCMATSGPGATNLLTGITGAWQDSSPVLFLTGQSKLAETIEGSGIAGLRQFGVFEVNIVPIVQSVTKYAVFLRDPKTVRYHLEKAIHLATTGRPGPVLIDIPLDIQAALIDPDELTGYEAEPSEAAQVDKAGVGQAIAELRYARRPLILAGQGIRVAGAAERFRNVTRQLGIPVVTTQMGKDLLPYDDECFVGHPGHKGDRAANFAVQSADFILSLGCSLQIQTTGYEFSQFAPQANKIQVELDPAIRERESAGFQHKIAMDVGVFLAEVGRRWGTRPWSPRDLSDWRARCAAWKTRYTAMSEPHEMPAGNEAANIYEFCDLLGGILPGGETILLDAGQPYFAMAHAFRLKRDQRYIVAGALGGMGTAVPFGIGVAASGPGRPAVVVTGDGSFHMNVQELQTIRHNRLDVKIFVIDNDGYASIRATQRTFFGGHFVGSSWDSGVTLPAVAKIAAAYGIPYIDCMNRSKLRESILATMNVEGPAICAVKTIPDQKIVPAVASVMMSDGRMRSGLLHEMSPLLPERETAAALAFC